MPDLVGARSGSRPGQRGPERAVVFIADVECLTVRIRDRIVEPGRQPVCLAVAAPRVAGAALTHEEAAPLVRHDVDPGERR